MRRRARDHVPLLTAVLSIVSLALVFGAVLQTFPTALVPELDGLLAAVPHINALVSATAIVVIWLAWAAIRRGDVRTHRRGMLAGLGLFLTFLALYLYRVSILGPTHFDGPAWIDAYVYVPLLAVHVLLAVICVPLLYYVVLLAVTRPVGDILATRHPTVGRITVVLWLVSFALGICVYLLLYWVF